MVKRRRTAIQEDAEGHGWSEVEGEAVIVRGAEHVELESRSGDGLTSPKLHSTLFGSNEEGKKSVLIPVERDYGDEQLVLLAKQRARISSLAKSLEAVEEENLSLKNQLKQYDQAMAASLARETRIQNERTKEMDHVVELYKKQISMSSELKSSADNERTLRIELEKEKDELRKELNSREVESSALKEEKDREANIFRLQLAKMQNDFEFELQNALEQIKLLEVRNKLKDEEIASTQNISDTLQKSLKELVESKTLKSEVVKTSSLSDIEKQEYKLIIRNLKEELATKSKLVEDAKSILKRNKNFHLLEEELMEERRKVDFLKNQIKSIADIETEYENTKRKLEDWDRLLKEFPNAENSESVLLSFSDLQKENILLMEKNSDLENQNFELRKTVQKLQDSSQLLEKDLTKYKNISFEMSELTKKKDILIKILEEEKNGLKNILLNSYAPETLSIDKNIQNELKIKDAVIQKLSDTLDESRKNFNTEYKSQINGLGLEQFKSKEKSLADLEFELLEKKENILQLERKNENLQQRNLLLEKNLSELLLKNEILENSPFGIKNLDFKILFNETFPRFVYELLKEKYDSDGTNEKRQKYFECFEKRKLIDKLIEMENIQIQTEQKWIQKFQNFRLACFLLFGYLVDIEANGSSTESNVCLKIILHSIYSQDPNEYFGFKFLESKEVEVEENQFTEKKEIADMVKTFIQDNHSIPAFLANLTLLNSANHSN